VNDRPAGDDVAGAVVDGPVWTIVVAGGAGRRFGAAKQFAPLGGRRVVDLACETAARAGDGVVVVLPSESVGDWPTGRATPVAGGSTRSESVRAGLAAVPAHATVICVHDAARPLATTALFRRVIAAVGAGADGAVPAVPVADTIKIVGDGGVVCSTPDRAALVAVQTPQAFRADVLRTAHAGADEGTDDASLVERRGGRVVTVAGEAANRKITTSDDLEWAQAGLVRPASPAPPVEVRVGNGFDVHRSGDDAARPLVLGGCVFPGLPGLVGHSDGDAVAHAVADALLGAAGLGDLGELFPDTAAEWAGADSVGLLAEVAERVRAERWRVGNADCSVVCETPKLAPRRAEMQRRLAAVLDAPVSVKGRRPEGLGALGRGEGVLCLASVVLTRSAEADGS
jgi:2-C-methyl-D-erythritol 4-phosphate cytidylyltransferase/2-C-methyl-D-erythritol 2,4-cyclodiphosphate synthase